MDKTPKTIERKPATNQSRRTFLTGSTSLGLILAAGTAPAFISEAGASKLRKVSFMLPWLFVGGHSFEFAAQKIFWKNRGLDVSIARGYGSGAATKAIATNQVQFSEASASVVVLGAARGLDVVLIGAKLQKGPMAISCRGDVGFEIKSPKDLERLHLVQAANSGDTVMFDGFAKAAGIDASKVKRTMVHPSKLLSTVISGRADCQGAYYVSNSATLDFKKPGAVHFLYADYGMNTLDLSMITTADMIKKDPDLVQLMVDGFMEGLKMQMLEPEKALDIMIAAKPELKTRPRKLLITQLGNTNALSIGPSPEKHGLGWMSEADQNKTRNMVVKYMPVKEVPPIQKLFTNQFAGNIKLTAAEWAKVKTEAAPYQLKKS